MIAYALLKLIWFFVIGIICMGFAVTGGSDLGVCALIPWLGKNDSERRQLLDSIGPTWEGNQVWLVTAGAALFAAWPLMYAAAFSSFYLAFLLVLLALILRPPGIDYRNKLSKPLWRKSWDFCLFISGFVPCLLFGVALGNLLRGLPFFYDQNLMPHPTGTFFNLLDPYALVCGFVSLSLLLLQACLFIQCKTLSRLRDRALRTAYLAGSLFILSFSLAWLGALFYIDGYAVVSIGDPNQALIPTAKEVIKGPGLWFRHYQQDAWGYIGPFLSILSVGIALQLARRQHPKIALVCNSVALMSVIFTLGFTLYPFVMPSMSVPNHSLTIWDTSASRLTLGWMLIAVIFFLPIVLGYTTWVFRIMRGPVNTRDSTYE
ncbi:MAG: cytochrome d ubiquinol oxidase subunit II [Gammaproteobacteria bacterium]|nr:cytochrome d ubiquinol oxidase subunit II [Gammaproteobacteria bacterium]MBP9728746.1 cytochrome d ubiquinol oxidase subunit II [Gammaproteobacteria bacterium]